MVKNEANPKNENPLAHDWQRDNVVQGVLIYEQKILLVGNDYGYPNLVWSLPGGRLEPGEQLPVALEREFQEETGLKIVPGELLYVVDARSEKDKRNFITCVFAVHLVEPGEGEPVPNCEGDAAVKQVRFFNFEEAARQLRPSMGEPLLNYLYYRENLARRYWRYAEYLRPDWQKLSWPPSQNIQAD